MLKYESPLVFDLIIQLSPQQRKKCPHPNLISVVCSASDDPVFDKSKFRIYLAEYTRHGLYCKRGKKPTPERLRYYERLRHNKLQRYIRQHSSDIELIRLALGQENAD